MWLAGYRGAATDKAKKSIGGTLGSAAQALRMGEGADLGEMWISVMNSWVICRRCCGL